MIGMTVGKTLTGILVVIAAYLILTNPKGDSAVGNSLFGGGVSTIKALQGR